MYCILLEGQGPPLQAMGVPNSFIDYVPSDVTQEKAYSFSSPVSHNCIITRSCNMQPLKPHGIHCLRVQLARNFSATRTIAATPRTNALQLLPNDSYPPPPYPYERAQAYKQRNTGLYAGAMIQFGNNIGPKSKVKTRRKWHPNIVHKQLYSRALDQTLRLKVRTRVLRTIDKVGGLDEYLLGGTSGRLKELGEEGWRLRWAVLQTPQIKKRLETDARLRHAVGRMNNAYASSKTLESDGNVGVEVEQELEEVSSQRKDELDVEERMRRRFVEDAYMREQPEPSTRSIWQRFTGVLGRRS